MDKFNEYLKTANSVADPTIELAKLFTDNEIAWLVKLGRVTRVAGWGNVVVDGLLMINDFRTGQPAGWHAYNAGIGIIGMIGWQGAVTAITIDMGVKGTITWAGWMVELEYFMRGQLMQGPH